MDKIYDIAVIGAGPAGLTAAIYARRAEKTVAIIDKQGYGGQIMNTPKIENYPGYESISGPELAGNMKNTAVSVGADIISGEVKDVEQHDDKNFEISSSGEKKLISKTIIIATGEKNRLAGLDREEELTGSGVSYCSHCDGAFFRNRDVAILGGGNTALSATYEMSGIAKKVYLVHRRDEFRGEKRLAEGLKEKDNVEIILNSVPKKLIGENMVSGIEIEDVHTGKRRTLDVSGVFVSFGHIPQNEALSGIVELDEKGYVKADESCETSCDGVFVAGDCRTKEVRQIVTATADGAVAALKAVNFLNV